VVNQYIWLNRRQFKCDKCKPFSEDLDFLSKNEEITKRLAIAIVKVLEDDIHSVAKRSHVTDEEIETMLKDIAEI